MITNCQLLVLDLHWDHDLTSSPNTTVSSLSSMESNNRKYVTVEFVDHTSSSSLCFGKQICKKCDSWVNTPLWKKHKIQREGKRVTRNLSELQRISHPHWTASALEINPRQNPPCTQETMTPGISIVGTSLTNKAVPPTFLLEGHTLNNRRM